MQLPELRLAARERGMRAPTRPRQLARWARTLPQGDGRRAAADVLGQLRRLNLHDYAPRQRASLNGIVRPLAESVLEALRRPLRGGSLAVEDGQRGAAADIQQLLQALADADRLVIEGLSAQSRPKPADTPLLAEAVHGEVTALSQRLLESYRVYHSEPPGVWRELHRLYRFAEERGLLERTVGDPHGQRPPAVRRSIELAYKRIVLLAIAEPYHLMPGEAGELYDTLAGWAGACEIRPLGELPPNGDYIVDLAVDMAPRYVPGDMQVKPAAGHILDIDAVREALDAAIQPLLSQAREGAAASRLAERQRRDRLMRLADTWSGHPARRAPRRAHRAQIQMTAGLNGCHYQLSGGAAFTPEMDALKITTSARRPSSMDLPASAEQTPQALFATAYREALQRDKRHQDRGTYAVHPWLQINDSEAGIALSCPPERVGGVRVGELAAYRFTAGQGPAWRIGAVRWLRQGDSGTVEMGIKNLADRAIAIGAKGIAGVGAHSEYFRALLLAGDGAATLITPAAIFDVGSELLINDRRQLRRVRLTRLLLSTRAFTQFEYASARQD